MDFENDASLVTRGMLRFELRRELTVGLNALERKLTIQILQSEAKTQKSSNEIKEGMGQFRGEIVGLIQDFAGILEGYKRETVTFPNTLDQHGKRLDDHESRIRSLES